MGNLSNKYRVVLLILLSVALILPSATYASPQPTILNMWAADPVVEPGDMLAINVRVRNDGTAGTAFVGGAVNCGSEPCYASPEWYCSATWASTYLSSGETKTVSTNWPVPDVSEDVVHNFDTSTWGSCWGSTVLLSGCYPDGYCSGRIDSYDEVDVFSIESDRCNIPDTLPSEINTLSRADFTGDQEWWKVDLPSVGGTLQVTLEGTPGNDVDLYVSSSACPSSPGDACKSNIVGHEESCSFITSQNTYYVHVNSYSGMGYYGISASYSPPNSNPTIQSIPDANVVENTPYSYQVQASDSDGDSLTYSLTTAPQFMTINSNTGYIQWNPGMFQCCGSFPVTVRVTDGNGGSATQSWTVTLIEYVPPPDPEFVYIHGETGIFSNSYADFEFKVINNGGQSPEGAISVSLENEGSVEILSSDTPLYRIFHAGNVNEPITHKDGYTFTPQHTLVEAWDNEWASGEEHTLKIRVYPKSGENTVVLNARSAMQDAGTGAWINQPADSANSCFTSGSCLLSEDQQGWLVTQFQIPVVAPPSPGGVWSTAFQDSDFNSGWNPSPASATNSQWSLSSTRSYTSNGVSMKSPNVDNAGVWVTHTVSLPSTCNSARIRFQAWQETQPPNDRLAVLFYNRTDGAWFVADRRSGSFPEWTELSYTIPCDTTEIGFAFDSDSSTLYEGVYVDDVYVEYTTRDIPIPKILDIWSSSSTISAGETATINVKVRNDGSAGTAYIGGSIGCTGSTCYTSPEWYCNTPWASTYLNVGEIKTVQMQWTAPTDAQSTTHSFIAGSWQSCASGGEANTCYLDGYCTDRIYDYFENSVFSIALNSPPVFQTFNPPTTATVGVQYSYQLDVLDPEGNALSYVRTESPIGLSVSSTGLVTWTPTSDQVQPGMDTHTVSIDVSDGASVVSRSWDITVSAAPSPPPLEIQSSIPASIHVEHAPSGVRVYKEAGDYVTFRIRSDSAQTFTASVPSSLDLYSGPLAGSTLTASAGVTELLFQISEDATSGALTLQLADSQGKTHRASVNVITRPELLVITSKNGLQQRYPSATESKIESLYQAAYARAGNKGIVYDLDEYSSIASRAWVSFAAYTVTPINPQIENTYPASVAQFIANRCRDGCGDVLILGDDFVIPHYRADITDLPWYNFLFNNPQSFTIFTDTPYAPSSVRPLREAGSIIEGTAAFAIVVPDETSTELRSEVNEFVNYLRDPDNNFNFDPPDFSGQGDVAVYNSSTIDCDSTLELQGRTLLLIGSRSDNNAIKCVPWFQDSDLVQGTYDASLFIERNVWGGGDYAFVATGNDYAAAVSVFQTFVDNPNAYETGDASEVFLYTFSNPSQELSAYEQIQGFVLGKCEKVGGDLLGSCIASDFAASMTPGIGVVTDARDAVMFCPTALISFAGEPEYLDTLVCAASLTGAIASVAVFADGVGVPADILSAAAKGFFKPVNTFLKSSGDKFFRAVSINPKSTSVEFKTFADFFGTGSSTDKAVIESAGMQWARILKRYKRSAPTLIEAFSESHLNSVLKSDMVSWERAFRGADLLGARSLTKTTLLTAIPFKNADGALDAVKQVEFLKLLGAAEETITEGAVVRKISFIESSKLGEGIGAKYVPKTQEILISKDIPWYSASGGDIAHEFGHARMHGVLGTNARKLAFTDPSVGVDSTLSPFSELYADAVVLDRKSSIGEALELREVERRLEFSLGSTQASVNDFLSDPKILNYNDELALWHAHAVKRGDSIRGDYIENFIRENKGAKADTVLALSKTYTDSLKNFDKLPDSQQVARLQKISDAVVDSLD